MGKEIFLQNETLDAIRNIFGDIEHGLAFLSIPARESDVDVPCPDRLLTLRLRLEGYIINMALELRELGECERERLQAEARGLLIALRELMSARL